MKPLRWVNSRPALAMIADVLVAHDGGLVVRRMRVELDVGAADAGDFHLHQRAVRPERPASDIRGFRSCSGRPGRPPALSQPLHVSPLSWPGMAAEGRVAAAAVPAIQYRVSGVLSVRYPALRPGMTGAMLAFMPEKPRALGRPRPRAGMGARALQAAGGERDPGRRGRLRGARMPADRNRDCVLVGASGGTTSRCSSRSPRWCEDDLPPPGTRARSPCREDFECDCC